MNGDNHNMKKEAEFRVLISGGGTGGHIFPALSIANEIKRRYPDADLLFVGAQGRMEAERVPAAGYNIRLLPVKGFDRSHLLKNFSVAKALLSSLKLAGEVVKVFKPHVAIGVGGYASGPLLWQAQRKGVPTLIQEQNSYAGVTNKLLARGADCICVAYEGMERFFPADKIVLTGNPVRRNLLECTATPEQARQAFGLKPDVPTILIVGGSLGARTINHAVIAGLSKIAQAPVQVIWQSGKGYNSECAEALAATSANNVRQMAFVTNMDMAYRAASLVVSRAGASSISEIQLLGKASLLVPSPNVAEDHQTKNAQALAQRNAAVMMPDRDANAKLVDTMLKLVTQSDVLQRIEQNVSAMALRDAAEHIVDHVERLVGKR